MLARRLGACPDFTRGQQHRLGRSAHQRFTGSATTPFTEGFEAFGFFGFSALGLRVSLFVFFWLLAMALVPLGEDAQILL